MECIHPGYGFLAENVEVGVKILSIALKIAEKQNTLSSLTMRHFQLVFFYQDNLPFPLICPSSVVSARFLG